MTQTAPWCACSDPTPVYRTATGAWGCYECGRDLTPMAVQVLKLHPVRSNV